MVKLLKTKLGYGCLSIKSMERKYLMTPSGNKEIIFFKKF